jgi:zinc-ribbon domain
MSKFCVQCGSAISENATFCTNCGANLGQNAGAPSPVQPWSSVPVAPPVAATGTAKKSGLSAGKIILIVVGFLVLVGIACVGEAVYMMHRIDTVNKKSASDTVSAVSSAIAQVASAAESKDASSSESKAADSSDAQRDACTLITKEEVGEATGTTVASASPNEDKDLCTYSPADGDTAVVTVQVNWHGGKIAMSALPGMTQSAIGKDIRQPVSGIGDEAYILGADEKTQKGLDEAAGALKILSSFATGPLMFRKGDVWVTVTATFAQNKAAAEKKMGSIIAQRI